MPPWWKLGFDFERLFACTCKCFWFWVIKELMRVLLCCWTSNSSLLFLYSLVINVWIWYILNNWYKVTILLLDISAGWTGFFCPCVLFGRNVEKMREDTPWTHPCICHAVCIEGGVALAAATAVFHGIDPRTSFLICEGLFFAWWMCGIYTGNLRQNLQKKYHLKVINLLEFITLVSLD